MHMPESILAGKPPMQWQTPANFVEVLLYGGVLLGKPYHRWTRTVLYLTNSTCARVFQTRKLSMQVPVSSRDSHGCSVHKEAEMSSGLNFCEIPNELVHKKVVNRGHNGVSTFLHYHAGWFYFELEFKHSCPLCEDLKMQSHGARVHSVVQFCTGCDLWTVRSPSFQRPPSTSNFIGNRRRPEYSPGERA